MIDLIETVIIYKLPHLTRAEIQAMLKVHDIRETKVYQEAKAEGIEEGIDREHAAERSRKLRSISKMATKDMAPREIAEILELDMELVWQELAKNQP